MGKTIKFGNALISLVESKAKCPHCERNIPFEEIEEKFMKQDKPFIIMKCKCKRFIGITSNIRGDYVAYKI